MTRRRGEQNLKDMTPEHGSFRDASNRVFYHRDEVFRSLSAEAAAN